MTAVILAAGMGNRYGGLKQIDPLGPSGEFIIDYSVYDAIRAGFEKVVFIIKRENYDIFRDTIAKRIEGKIQVEYAFQDPEDLPDGLVFPAGRSRRCFWVVCILPRMRLITGMSSMDKVVFS